MLQRDRAIPLSIIMVYGFTWMVWPPYVGDRRSAASQALPNAAMYPAM